MNIIKEMGIILMAFQLISCANTDSEDIKTSAFCARYSVENDGSNTTAKASWQVGCGLGGSWIELSANDMVYVKVNSGAWQSMSKENLAGIISYKANISSSVGDTITIRLEREEEGNYDSSTTIPAQVNLSSPSSGDNVTQATALSFNWTAGSGSFMSFSNTRTYNDNGSVGTKTSTVSNEADDGSFTSTTDFTETNQSSTETGNLTVTRNTSGTVNSSFEGGYFYGKHSTSLSINLTP